jgi:hypothetical protein
MEMLTCVTHNATPEEERQMEPVAISREELYKLIWETPTKHLCKQFGLSDVGLAKTCKRHNIPKPPPGYWAKKAHGWGVRKTPLPKCSDPMLEKIEFRQDEVPKEEPSQFFDPEIEVLYEQELKSEPITVRSSLRGAHPLVIRTRDGGDDEWGLAVSASEPLDRRALLIMDAILRGLEKRGYQVKKPESQWSKYTTIVGYGHEFGLRLREPTKRSIKNLTPQEIEYRKKYPSAYNRTEYEYNRTGTLQLEITHCPNWNTKVIRDGKKTLEERLAGLPGELLRAIDATRRQEAEWAEAERKREEAVRLREEEKAREKRRQERLARRRQREEVLFRTAERWRRCDLLRQFAEAVRQVAVEEIGSPDADPKIARWLVWAERVAERQDPLVRLRRSGTGRRRPR